MDPNAEQQPAPTPPPAPAPAATPDAPDKETMEQIRRRRLEKLGGGFSSSSTPAGTERSSPKPENGAGPSRSTTTSPANSKPTTESGKSTPAPQESRPKISVTPLPQQQQPTPAGSVSQQHLSKRKAADIDSSSPPPATTPPPPRKQTPQNETIEDYTDKVLASIFRITLDPDQTTDRTGAKVAFLPNLSQELADDDAPRKLSLDRLEEAIMEAVTAVPEGKPLFDYFLPCWKRVTRMIKMFRGNSPQKEAVLKEARRLCFSNCVFALTMPELFGRESNPQHDNLKPYILKGVDSEEGLCMEFFREAVSRRGDDDSIIPLFTRAMVDISNELGTMSMKGGYKPYVNALLTYSKFQPLLIALAEHPFFQMAQSAPGIEKNTILGPFFRLSPLQPDVTKDYFGSPRTMDQGQIKANQGLLQMTLSAHQNELFTIVDAFFRCGLPTRNKMLDWFAYIVNVNHKRRALQVDPREVSSDGFMVNVTVVLDFMSQPFMDSTFSKVGRIEHQYFRRNPRVDIKDETKLNADQAQSDKFYETREDGGSGFNSEIFFLTLAAHHYGSEAANTKMKQLDKDIKYYIKNLALIEAERPKLAGRPAQLRLLETTIARHVAVLEKSMSMKLAIEGVLLDEKMQSRSLQFMRYVTVWLLRVASGTDYTPDKQITLPLKETPPEAWNCLPEYALQDIVDNFKFIYRYIPSVMVSAVGEELVALCVTFLESSQYIKNPYLKSSLVTLLFHGTWPILHRAKGILGDLLTGTKFANSYLLHALMKFYIECESTGVSSQFYDKFNIRYEIFQVIKCVWSNDVYKRQLVQSSKSNRQFFVRFVNLLMNDATYVLDEGLSKFPKIHDLQIKLRDPQLSQEDRDKLDEELKTAEGQASSYMQLVNETVSMMELFTSTLADSFTMPEIVQRLAGMLNYNLEILTGPKSKTLKVENPAKYHFNPRTLLPEIVGLYLNLGSRPAFIQAVAADGRSYKPAMMTQVTHILRSKAMKTERELEAWEGMCHKFAQKKEELDQADMDFDDAPEEFEDPIMGDLMQDPVVLPSGHIVDRGTIVQHLLSDQTNPFNRNPMSIDDVQPATELKERIGKWKEERRSKSRGAAGGGDPMDTTE